MANNNKDQLVQKDFPYPPAGNFKPCNYNQEVKEAILAATKVDGFFPGPG